jgi:predicted glycosyltransferase
MRDTRWQLTERKENEETGKDLRGDRGRDSPVNTDRRVDMRMKIWIDLANAPHVAFFLPIVHELERKGHQVAISMRDFNQTVELARKSGLRGTVIGTHGGKSLAGKVFNLVNRVAQLASFGAKVGADVAVSHNSYAQTIAGRLLGTKVVTIMDYEGQPANHVAFRFANRVVVPNAFPEEALRRFGCKARKVVRYNGFKEQVYLSDFRPRESFLAEFVGACGLPKSWDPSRTVVLTVRTPASIATYHRFTNHLFERLLESLNSDPNLTVVLLPRTSHQRKFYTETYSHLHVPSGPISGNDLVHFSDVVVSAGGTMNREAAVLGTPVFTIFGGELPAVDKELIAMGRLVSIRSEDDIRGMPLTKKRDGNLLKNPGLLNEMVDRITSW